MFEVNDYKDMEFNPTLIPEGFSVLEYYKRLQRIPEFIEDIRPLDTDKVLRYIICMYSINSPYLSIDNLMQRKVMAAGYAGFSNDKKLIQRGYQEILYGKNIPVMKMIVRFCRMSHSMEFMKLMILEESIYTEYLAFTEMDSTEKAKTLQNIEKMEMQIKNLTRSMFYGVDERLEQGVLEVIEMERELELKPEDYARKPKLGRPRNSMKTIPDSVETKQVRTVNTYDRSDDRSKNSIEDFFEDIAVNPKMVPNAAKEEGYNKA